MGKEMEHTLINQKHIFPYVINLHYNQFSNDMIFISP